MGCIGLLRGHGGFLALAPRAAAGDGGFLIFWHTGLLSYEWVKRMERKRVAFGKTGR
jgi:hypothetical protein